MISCPCRLTSQFSTNYPHKLPGRCPRRGRFDPDLQGLCRTWYAVLRCAGLADRDQRAHASGRYHRFWPVFHDFGHCLTRAARVTLYIDPDPVSSSSAGRICGSPGVVAVVAADRRGRRRSPPLSEARIRHRRSWSPGPASRCVARRCRGTKDSRAASGFIIEDSFVGATGPYALPCLSLPAGSFVWVQPTRLPFGL